MSSPSPNPSRSRSPSLTPPVRVHIEDPGAREFESDSEEHFSDARSSTMTPTPASPIPRTRVEKVSDEPSYGEIPGTEAYGKRTGDAAPDEIAVIPDANETDGTPVRSRKGDVGGGRESPLPGGRPIPVTVVEEAAGNLGPHSEEFVEKHKADASPDLVIKPDGDEVGRADSDEHHQDQEQEQATQDPIPVLPASVSPVVGASPQHLASPSLSPPGAFPDSDFGDEAPTVTGHDESEQDAPVEGATAQETEQLDESHRDDDGQEDNDDVTKAEPEKEASAEQDAQPEADPAEEREDEFADSFEAPPPAPEEPDSKPAARIAHNENEDGQGGDDGFGDVSGDDFDDFEERDNDADFGDFGDDDDFQQPESTPAPPPAQPPVREASPQPAIRLPLTVPDFDGLESDEVLSLLDPYLAHLFPPEQLSTAPDLPPPPAKGDPVFLTPRSASLWSQLVAPPPLAPPDWIRSRIRRAFLVSLGVPVDLDEILPASKQKKLILPSLAATAATSATALSSSSPRTSSDLRSVSRLRADGANTSSTSLDSQGNPKRRTAADRSGSPSKPRRGPPAEPEFDLVSARQLCATTTEALDGMTDEELRGHLGRLEALQTRSRDVLEYWQKRADAQIGDREAFEGVIENLVKHARKVRK